MLVLMRVLGLCGLLYGGWQGCMNDGHVFGRGGSRESRKRKPGRVCCDVEKVRLVEAIGGKWRRELLRFGFDWLGDQGSGGRGRLVGEGGGAMRSSLGSPCMGWDHSNKQAVGQLVGQGRLVRLEAICSGQLLCSGAQGAACRWQRWLAVGVGGSAWWKLHLLWVVEACVCSD